MPAVIVISGHLGKDPSTRTAGSGTVTELSVGSTEGFGDKQTTTWFRASIWGKSGDAAVKFLKKGDGVIITGRCVLREYEKKEGGKGYSLEVQNASWDFPPTRKTGGGGGGGQQQQAQGETYNDETIPF